MAQLVETVTGRTMAELIAARDAATRADMVELRLDGVEDVNVRGALSGRRLPVIVTCRAAWEGGHFDGSEEQGPAGRSVDHLVRVNGKWLIQLRDVSPKE